jgi:hypothetical protein
MSTAQAAGILVHYIELALERAGTPVTPDMREELNDAIDAFKRADKAAAELHSLHP